MSKTKSSQRGDAPGKGGKEHSCPHARQTLSNFIQTPDRLHPELPIPQATKLLVRKQNLTGLPTVFVEVKCKNSLQRYTAGLKDPAFSFVAFQVVK